MEMQSGVYEIRNTVNGKRYIGSATRFGKRWSEHRRHLRNNKHHSVALQRAWNKYGAEAFVFARLLVCSPEHRLMYEQRCLDRMSPEYNTATDAVAAMDGRTHSAETRAKMSRAGMGRVFSLEHKLRIGAAHKGRKHALGYKQSPETCAKVSAGLKGKPKSPEHRAKLAAAKLGTKLSLETREKIGAFSRGKPWTAERRAAQPRTYAKVAKRKAALA